MTLTVSSMLFILGVGMGSVAHALLSFIAPILVYEVFIFFGRRLD